MAHANFDGLRVLSLESRRATEVTKLIRTYGGEPTVVSAMREIPIESNRPALQFADRLLCQVQIIGAQIQIVKEKDHETLGW